MTPLVLGILQVLPQLVSTGFSVYNLVTHTNGVAPAPTSDVERFATTLLAQLPNLLDLKADITELVTQGAEVVRQAELENRGPTNAEWDAQDARLAVLDSNYDKAAARK